MFMWANNRKGEGFIQERLDRFFGSGELMVENDRAVLLYVLRQSSNHSFTNSKHKTSENKNQRPIHF